MIFTVQIDNKSKSRMFNLNAKSFNQACKLVRKFMIKHMGVSPPNKSYYGHNKTPFYIWEDEKKGLKLRITNVIYYAKTITLEGDIK